MTEAQKYIQKEAGNKCPNIAGTAVEFSRSRFTLGATTLLDHVGKAMEWASLNGWAYNAGYGDWVNIREPGVFITPEMVDKYFKMLNENR